MVHRKNDHYNTVAVCRNGLSCEYLDKCWWKHKKDAGKNLIECYYCKESFKTQNEVMKHRKTKHIKTVKNCSKFANMNCMRNEESCWFRHEMKEGETEETKNLIGNGSVFRKPQINLRNP